MISIDYKNIVSKDEMNFFNIYDLSFIDNNYIHIINKLIDVIKLIYDTKSNQLGGYKKQKQKYRDNEEITQLKKKINELTEKIVMLQQQQLYLNNINHILSRKAEICQNTLIQHHTDLTQCKTDNKITLYKFESQQNELNKCKADREILTNDNSNLKEKILFFDKSLEILSKEIDKNLNNGMIHLKKFEENIEVKPRENITTVNIELTDKLSEDLKVIASSNASTLNVKPNSIPKKYPYHNPSLVPDDYEQSYFFPERQAQKKKVNRQHITPAILQHLLNLPRNDSSTPSTISPRSSSIESINSPRSITPNINTDDYTRI